MKKSIGMAIRITEDNREKLSVVNSGIVPEVEENETTYFYFPYSPFESCAIYPHNEFFTRYEFANQEATNVFVDVNLI